ncbi:hypothetical protein N7486_008951 [Penicillium sp. IBT 16267x]|nr:hypothetical protein N7486_008951 [Penicillium sp. IBT 16267x]
MLLADRKRRRVLQHAVPISLDQCARDHKVVFKLAYQSSWKVLGGPKEDRRPVLRSGKWLEVAGSQSGGAGRLSELRLTNLDPLYGRGK